MHRFRSLRNCRANRSGVMLKYGCTTTVSPEKSHTNQFCPWRLYVSLCHEISWVAGMCTEVKRHVLSYILPLKSQPHSHRVIAYTPVDNHKAAPALAQMRLNRTEQKAKKSVLGFYVIPVFQFPVTKNSPLIKWFRKTIIWMKTAVKEIKKWQIYWFTGRPYLIDELKLYQENRMETLEFYFIQNFTLQINLFNIPHFCGCSGGKNFSQHFLIGSCSLQV